MIHKYSMFGYNIVLDVESGGVYVVDELTFNMLDKISLPMSKTCPDGFFKEFSKYTLEAIQDSYSEIYSLYENRRLFTRGGEYEKYRKIAEQAPIKAMCLHVAHDCNLRCKYCFASKGDFGGNRELMSIETAKRAIDFLINNSGRRKNLEVDFFGGEPLMNFDVVKKTVEYARAKEKDFNKHFRFTITTNGVLLTDDKIDYLNSEMDNVVLSLDGRKEVNDKMRPKVDGSGSYDTIIFKFLKLVKNRGEKDYYVRGTFTKHNLDFSNDVLHINSCGFDYISVEPVVCGDRQKYAIGREDLPKIYKEYEILAKKIVEKKKNNEKINFFHFMVDLKQGPCVIKRLHGCGCGNEYIAISPDGCIYPCHQFVGMKEWNMGNVYKNILDQNVKNKFSRTTIFDKEKCGDCWAKFYCSGGCNANNYLYAGGDILRPYEISCQMEKKRIECAIMIKAALSR